MHVGCTGGGDLPGVRLCGLYLVQYIRAMSPFRGFPGQSMRHPTCVSSEHASATCVSRVRQAELWLYG
jgi:hypothetical protein